MLANFYCTSTSVPNPGNIQQSCVEFHGAALDVRGESAFALSPAPIVDRRAVAYDYDEMTVSVGGLSANADSLAEVIRPMIENRRIVLEGTTLGFAELFCLVHSLISLKIVEFDVTYLEPLNYSPAEEDGSFKLSELIPGYHPIPNAVIDLSGSEVESGVFFLGYESERLARALEEFQMIASKDIKLVFCVPAYKPGWELNSIVPHLSVLQDHANFQVAYCCASDPGSAFDALEKTRISLAPGRKMFVAPIGPKPCGVASAVFASLYPNQVGLLYDHPRRKIKRSTGVGLSHLYSIHIQY
jgi:hypothetical protein